MARIENFEDIGAWQKARVLSQKIFECTRKDDFSRDWSLRDQILRSSGSVMDNIAEGFERGGNREFIQFLGYAKGSCGEVRSQLYRAFDRSYISEETFQELFEEAKMISRMVNGFIRYLKNSDYKGFKLSEPDPDDYFLESNDFKDKEI